MNWLRGSAVKCALLGLGLLTTSCAGAIGAGAATLVVGAGIISMTCYDRMAVVVTDRQTGAKLCDAKVTFTEGKSVTEANSCYSAALSTGNYRLKVERDGLLPYEAPVEINTGSKCRHAVQTIYVALDRPGTAPPQQASAALTARTISPSASVTAIGASEAASSTPSTSPVTSASSPPPAPSAPAPPTTSSSSSPPYSPAATFPEAH